MSRGTHSPATVHSPLLLDWTEEKLSALDQDQLVNLLENLDRQRAVGRLSEATAAVLDQRIRGFITKRPKRRAAGKAVTKA